MKEAKPGRDQVLKQCMSYIPFELIEYPATPTIEQNHGKRGKKGKHKKDWQR